MYGCLVDLRAASNYKIRFELNYEKSRMSNKFHPLCRTKFSFDFIDPYLSPAHQEPTVLSFWTNF